MLFAKPYQLDISTFWDGTPCAENNLRGMVELEGTSEGLKITAMLPHQPTPNIPNAPTGTRVSNLWEYDVVECFLVGEEKYLEVELGAGGHWLVLSFTAPRVRSEEYVTLQPKLNFESNGNSGRWHSSIVIPWTIVPAGLTAANAFVIVGDNFLCASALPGEKADFHQPQRFPKIPQSYLV